MTKYIKILRFVVVMLLVVASLVTAGPRPRVSGVQRAKNEKENHERDHITKQREYFVGIVERNWDYSPNLRNEITGKDILPNRCLFCNLFNHNVLLFTT